MSTESIIQAIVESLQQPQSIEIDPATPRGAIPFVALPTPYKVENLEQYLPAPVRIRKALTTGDLASFIAYILRFSTLDTCTFVYTDAMAGGGMLARTVLDYHGPDAPAWGDHTIALKAKPSLAYSHLLALEKSGFMAQADFAMALRDVARFCTSHPAAEIVEVARTMALTSKGDFRAIEDDFSGSVDFRYDLAVAASAGSVERKLQVPRQIDFDVPLLEGLPSVTVTTELLYRIPRETGGKVSLGLRIPDRTWLEEAAVHEIATAIEAKTNRPVFTVA